MFAIRNIANPYGLLMQHGLSRRTAYNIAHKQVQVLKLQHLYLICKLCNCTPNDVIRYQPAETDSLKETHALNKIKGTTISANAKELLAALSLEDLDNITSILMKKKEVQT
jgi:DNA-binding Xre family transcriptional regulator